MEIQKLAGILSNMYNNAARSETYNMLYLFGIKYSNEIRSLGTGEVVKMSGIPIAYNQRLGVSMFNNIFLRWRAL